MSLPMTLWDPQAFAAKDHDEQLVFGAYFGFFLVIILFSLVVFLGSRDRVFLHYFLYVASFAFWQFSDLGLSYEYLWPGAPGWNRISGPLAVVFPIFFAILFCRSFLDTRERLPSMDLVLRAFLVVCVFVLPMHLVVSFSTGLTVNLAMAGATPLLMLGVAILSVARRTPAASYYLVAWLLLLAGVLVTVTRQVGLLPSNFVTRYATQIGAAAEVFLLPFGIGYKINLMNREREAALQQRLRQSQRVAALSSTFDKYVPHEFLEALQAPDITELQLISRHRGFIDKYLGDAIMALFDRADDAVLAAIEMQAAVEAYNQERAEVGRDPIRIGIGINTGTLMLGIVGGEERLEGTVVSDAVNLAARIEEMTKRYGASVLIGEATYLSLEDPSTYQLRVIDHVRAKGKKEPVTVVEVYDADPAEARERKRLTSEELGEGLSALRAKDYPAAITSFRRCLSRNPGDKAVRVHLESCRKHLREPGRRRRGVFELDPID